MSRWDTPGTGSNEPFESVRIIKPPKPTPPEAIEALNDLESTDDGELAWGADEEFEPERAEFDAAHAETEPTEPPVKQRSVIYINADAPGVSWAPPATATSPFAPPDSPSTAASADGSGSVKPRPVIIIDADAPVLGEDGEPLGKGASTAEVDPRFRARRRAIKRAEGRRRFRVLIALFSVMAFIVVVSLVLQSPLFSVRTVRIDGLRFADRAAVTQVAESLRGQPLYRLDQDKAKEAILIQPWVRRVRIVRTWPRTVTIDIAERTPVATAQLDDGLWRIIDIEGHVLSVSDGQPQNYLVIEGDPKAVEVGGVLSAPMVAGLRLADSLPDRLKASQPRLKLAATVPLRSKFPRRASFCSEQSMISAPN